MDYVQNILRQTANDLIRKKLIREEFADRLQDQTMANPVWKASVLNFILEDFHDFQCPECMITIRAPKEWIKWHAKTHFNPDKKKENEMQIIKMNPYRDFKLGIERKLQDMRNEATRLI